MSPAREALMWARLGALASLAATGPVGLVRSAPAIAASAMRVYLAARVALDARGATAVRYALDVLAR